MINWDPPDDDSKNWDDYDIWEYIEETEENWLEGDVEALIVRNDNLSIPDDFSLAFGPADLGNRNQERNRIWICHRTIDGEIFLRQSDIEWEEYIHSQQLVFAPVDSRYPSLIFNRNNQYVVFVELTPAHNYTGEGDISSIETVIAMVYGY